MIRAQESTSYTGREIMECWLASGQSIRISGLDFVPMSHPAMPTMPRCVMKGQATAFFLRQVPFGNTWLLKKFAPSRRPTDKYLEAATRCLPGGIEFFTCTQRRLLTARHLDRWNSGFSAPGMAQWLEGTILMPKVPGSPWSSVADSIRDGELQLTLVQRLQAALNLTECIIRLEAAGCTHRDLSSTNVFYTEDGRIYLIDWDCLYHSSLAFQPNTTPGTMGYIAPFIGTSVGDYDASISWWQRADRFALAILITEFLLTSPQTPPQEDGTLFSQDQLHHPQGDFVQEQLATLTDISKRCQILFRKVLHASSFDECPSPDDWQSALRNALRLAQNNRDEQPSVRSDVKQVCPHCNRPFWISQAKLDELQSRGKQVLCKVCLQTQLNEWAATRQRRDESFPEINCEHCQQSLRVPRARLDHLRLQGKPILCRSCLADQMKKWNAERSHWEKSHIRTACAQCRTSFRINEAKLDLLQTKGKSVLCRDCLELHLQLNGRIQ